MYFLKIYHSDFNENFNCINVIKLVVIYTTQKKKI